MSYKKKRQFRTRLKSQKIYHYFLDALVLLISKLLFPEKKADPAPPPVVTDHFCEAGIDPDGWETICSVCKKRKAKADRVESLQGVIDEKRIYLK